MYQLFHGDAELLAVDTTRVVRVHDLSANYTERGKKEDKLIPMDRWPNKAKLITASLISNIET